MIGDFLTKPLQGALFYKLSPSVLNLSPDGVLPVSSTFASPQECVGIRLGLPFTGILPPFGASSGRDPCWMQELRQSM
jgi:hypothetical protein